MVLDGFTFKEKEKSEDRYEGEDNIPKILLSMLKKYELYDYGKSNTTDTEYETMRNQLKEFFRKPKT